MTLFFHGPRQSLTFKKISQEARSSLPVVLKKKSAGELVGTISQALPHARISDSVGLWILLSLKLTGHAKGVGLRIQATSSWRTLFWPRSDGLES